MNGAHYFDNAARAKDTGAFVHQLDDAELQLLWSYLQNMPAEQRLGEGFPGELLVIMAAEGATRFFKS